MSNTLPTPQSDNFDAIVHINETPIDEHPALRGVIRTARKLGYLSTEDYQRAVDVANVKSKTLPSGCDVRPLEMKALLDTCNLNDEPTRKLTGKTGRHF